MKTESYPFDWSVYTDFEAIPGNADEYGQLSREEIEATFHPLIETRPLGLRYAMSRLAGPIRVQYVYGHHDVATIQEDLNHAGKTLTTLVGHIWMISYRHAFTCRQPAVDPNVCGCAGDDGKQTWDATVPARCAGAVPVTVIRYRNAKPSAICVALSSKNRLAVPAAEAYREIVLDEGLTDVAESLSDMIERIRLWQQENPDQVRTPGSMKTQDTLAD
jgi:hypothetical protein